MHDPDSDEIGVPAARAPAPSRALAGSLALAALIAVAATGASVQEEPPPAPAPANPASGDPLPVPLTEYMGRRIAPFMTFEGGPWLMRATREKEERCSELLAALRLEPGQVVADVGCGNGFYTFKLAELVGEEGRVFAVDIQPEMLAMLEKEAERRGGLGTVETILSTPADPLLPEQSVDLAFLVDVYHELSHPVEMLAALRRSLKPGGRIVIVEFRLEDPEVPIKLLHKMTKAQLVKELAANGFDAVEEFDELPWQHVVFFAPRAQEPVDGAEGDGGEAGGDGEDGGDPGRADDSR
jgi:ubiquinone/menaquinone biosynthesis C-methylase UbiE